MPLRPAPALLWILLGWTIFGIVASVNRELIPTWRYLGYGLAGIAVLDAIILYLKKRLTAERSIPGRFALGVSQETAVTVHNVSKRALKIDLFDGVPESGTSEGLPWRGKIPGHGHTSVRYPLSFHQRGEPVFSKVQALEVSAFGFWTRFHLLDEPRTTRVYPNYQPVLRFALLAMEQRQEVTGVIHKNKAGLSKDFHQLRDYQPGDSLAQVDWKASSKRQSLVSREFQEQRDQSLVLMLDSGRRMRSIDYGLPQFDHALNASMLLGYLALRQGDSFAMGAFGGTHKWLPPVKGVRNTSTVLNFLYDLETTPAPSDFQEAVRELLRNQRRRSLVVLLTNLRAEDDDELLEPLKLLQRKHVVIVASLQEENLEAILSDDLRTSDDALTYLAAQDYQRERTLTLAKLRAAGITAVDTTAKKLPVALANAYLDVRSRL